MAVDIKFGGVNLAVPEGDNTDGLMGMSHNVLFEDGALRPIALGEKVAEVDADYIYVHDNGYRHYIALKRKTITTYTITAYDENYKSINDFDGEYDYPKSVTVVGNTVIVSANEKMYYFLWKSKEGKYVFLGNAVPRVNMTFGLQGELLAKGYAATHINFEGGQKAQSTFKILGIYKRGTADWTETGLTFKKGTNYAFYATTDIWRTVTLKGKNSAGKEVTFFASQLHGILLRKTWVCDDNYTDIYINIPSSYNVYIEEGSTLSVDKTITVNEDNYTKAMAIMNSFVSDYAIEKDRFIYPFFVRYAVKMYSGDYLYISPPVLMIPNSGYAPMTTYAQNKATDEIFAYAFVADLQYSIKESVSEDWADIISGVDIFVSQQLYPYNQGQEFNEGLEDLFTYDVYDKANSLDTVTGKSTGYLKAYFGNNNISYDMYKSADLAGTILSRTSLNYFLVFKTAAIENIEEKICNTGSFYHFKTIEFADLKASGTETSGSYTSRKMIDINPAEGTLTNLVTRRALTDDVLSNRTVVSGKLHAYNNRLHVYGATVRLPSPVPLQDQVAFLSCSGAGDIIKSVRVYLHTEEGDRNVAYEADESTPFDCVVNHDGLCWFFYPDNQAYQVEIYYQHNFPTYTKYYKVTLPLKQHELLNGAYWYSGAMSGVNIFADNADEETYTPPTVVDTLSKPHTVYVSEVNNPFVFSSKSAVSVGCSEIYKLSSAAKALSSGQFGQFPLYAFCDNGIWALETSSEGVYVARQPITRDVCTNINSVTQIDSGVVFVTARGIMCLYGSEVTCLSGAMTERSVEALNLPRVEEIVFKNVTCGTDALTDHLPFINFIQSCDIAYDYTNQRLIVTANRAVFYGYVYSFVSGCWATINADKLMRPINSYPDAMYLGTYEADTEQGSETKTCIYNMSKRIFEGSQGCYAITRPMNLGSNAYKTINELAVRGAFDRGDVRLLLYGSNDGRRWHIVSSSKTYKLQGYSGSPYKKYVLVMMADLEYADYISSQTVDYMNRLTDKLR